MTEPFETNFDGMVGPTHNYGGLSFGNVASMAHGSEGSSPRTAAWQGLAKMKILADSGYPQAVLPPHERPAISWLRRWGFGNGTDAEVLARAAARSPERLAAASSASSMWAANAATVTASIDAGDGRVHFTAANLNSKLHRSIEAEATARTLRTIFSDEECFSHHSPLGGGPAGAATG